MLQEREKQATPVQEIPENVNIPQSIERKEGVVAIPTQFTAQVSDDKGTPLISSGARIVKIKVPKDDKSLMEWSKGSSGDARSWWALFWQRIVKKALRFGWQVIRGG